MKTIMTVTENLKVIGNGKELYIYSPSDYKDGMFTTNHVLVKLAHLNTILTQIERVLNVDFNCTVKQSAKPTFTLKGGLTKVPFQIIQHEPVEKIGFNK